MIGLPLALGAVQLTWAWLVAGLADTPVGAPGAIEPVGVTEFDWADTGPVPLLFAAWTVNVYAVPAVRPLMVVLVAGGAPVTVVGVWAVDPMYGVTM